MVSEAVPRSPLHDMDAAKHKHDDHVYGRSVHPTGHAQPVMGEGRRFRATPPVLPSLSRRVPPSPEWSPAPSTDSALSDSMRGNMQQQPSYVGYIKSPADAVLLLAACDMPCSPHSSVAGNIPRRITRRLLDDERASLIRSGSIFVWDESEASMRRWTDGRCWSASRVSGCFLTYRELEMRKKASGDMSKEGPIQNLYKTDGLTKQSFSITTASNRKLHVISYFRKQDVRMGLLRRVSEDPRITGTGPESWNVHVDEKEFGELLNRENEQLPETVTLCRPGEMPLTPTHSDFRDMKRFSSERERDSETYAEEMPMRSRISPVNYMPRRPMQPSPPYAREMDGHMTYPMPYALGEDVAMKRYRYDHAPMYLHYPSSAYSQMLPYNNAPIPPPTVMPSGPTPRGVMPMRNGPPPPLPAMNRSYAHTSPNGHPSYMPRRTDMEQESIEALVSLRTDPASGTAYQPPMPFPPRDVKNSAWMRQRPTPVSAPDRDALQKLSVRV